MSESVKIKTRYQRNYAKHGLEPKALSWTSRGAAHQRFRQIWAEIDFNNKSVLDVGAGFGELGKFLSKRYKNVDYKGVDIVPEFVEQARRLYPYLDFEERNILEKPTEEKFDVVVASGVLNSNVEDNMDFRRRAIKVMFEHAEKIFVFNMLGGHPQPETRQGSNIWYADSLEVLGYCMSLTRRVLLRHHYHPRDFTIFMYPTSG